MNLNITYDQNTLNTAPSGFFNAVNYVVSLFDVTFTNNATVNIEIGYGTFPYDNSPAPALGESMQNGLVWGNYSQVRQALINEGAPGSTTLPSSSPLSGGLVLDSAQEKALGLIGPSNTLDGWVGIASDATLATIGGSWSYSATATPGANQYYLVGVLEHEITEIMGRTSYLDVRGEHGVMDFYRYRSPGVRQTGAGSPAYFSTDGGTTNLDSWNTLAGGDIGDWADSADADAFRAFSPPGQINRLTSTDITNMAAIGWTTSGTPLAGSVSINDVSISEGDSGTKVMTFTVTRAGGTGAFTVNYATADNSATATDGAYVTKSGTLSFSANDTTQTISIVINGDTKIEPNGTFFVNLSAPTNGAVITDSQGLGTIINDDLLEGLVNASWYKLQYPDVAAAGTDPLQHYNTVGWKEGRNPNAFFSTTEYLDANPDVKEAANNPLTHYQQFGWKEGRDPSLDFDDQYYLAKASDVKATGVDPLQHYLNFGQNEGRSIATAISGNLTVNGFDSEYYLMTYHDVTAAGIDPVQHYNTLGWKEGRSPNAFFSTTGYLNANSDVKAAGVNPLTHYHQFGWTEGRDPGPNFDTDYYLAQSRDVKAAGIDPLLHYLQNGRNEGRAAAPAAGVNLAARDGVGDIDAGTGGPSMSLILSNATDLVDTHADNQPITSESQSTVLGPVDDTIFGGAGDLTISIDHSQPAGPLRIEDTGVRGYDTVVGFSQSAGDRLSFANETAAAIDSVVGSAHTNNGNTILTLPDGATVTLVGITHIDSSFFA